MRKLLAVLILVMLCKRSSAQNEVNVDTATANAALQKCASAFPKFYREFQLIKRKDILIKAFVFTRTEKVGAGPAFARPNGRIYIDLRYLESPPPGFDDDRLIVVLYHEIGHLHYFVTVDRAQWNPDDNEKAAFEYSLLKTKEIATQGDCMPLKIGLKFMKIRSEGTNLTDPHVKALKRMVKEPLYFDYLKYVKEKCG